MVEKKPRFLLKLSGEALGGESGSGLDPQVLRKVAQEIGEVQAEGNEIAIVCGGGNIFRGMQIAAKEGIERTVADQMGMLATVQNGLALRSFLEQADIRVRLMSAITMNQIAEQFNINRAFRHFEKGRVLILAGGTSQPYFTTDTAAALYAAQLKVDVVIKATNVDGVYDKDPHKHDGASHFPTLTYLEMLERRLVVFDLTATTMLQENKIPIKVYNMKRDSLLDAVRGLCKHTLVNP